MTVLPVVARNGVKVSRSGQNVYVELGAFSVVQGGGAKDIAATDCGKHYTNKDEDDDLDTHEKNLPAATAGLHYDFHDVNGEGIRAVAANGDTIVQDADESIAGGYVESTERGWLKLVCLEDGVWTAYPVRGIWALETA